MKTKIYFIILAVINGDMKKEQAVKALTKLIKKRKKQRKKTDSQIYSGKGLKDIPFGLYEVFWRDGGSSLASVGNMYNGQRWIACTNWTSKDNPTGLLENHIKAIDRMVLLHRK